MVTTIGALLGTKYGKWIFEIVVVVGLVFGAYKWAEHRGRTQQKETDDQHQSQEIETSRREASDAKNQLVKQANDKASAAEADAKDARAQFTTLANLLQGLSAKEKAGHDQVGKIADSELHADVIGKLGLRRPGDVSACYLPSEERTIDEAVTQYPICKDEKTALTSQVASKQREVSDNEKVIAAKQQALDANDNYLKLLENDYKTLFEQHPPRYRSAGCLFLWSCGKRKVELKLPERK
jgi:uncharacterized protein HemX